MRKAELRKIYNEKRGQLSDSEIEKLTDLVLINFQKIPLPFIEVAHSFVASQKLGEIDTSAFMRYLEFTNPGLKMLIPRIDLPSGAMYHVLFHDDVEFLENIFGIAEPLGGESLSPLMIDLVLVPLLAFDVRGYRVGYGKGYYDKFLFECRPDVIKIGLSFFEPEIQIDDVNQFDISLNYCVTPHRVFDFTVNS